MTIRILLLTILLCGACHRNIKTEFYPSGKKRLEAETNKEGTVNGMLRTFHENGQTAYEGKYTMDKKIGWHKQFYENGILQDEFLFEIKDGQSVLTEKRKYGKNGLIFFHSKIASKKITVSVLNENIYVNDVVKVRINIVDPKYENSAVMIGSFDANLNPLEDVSLMKDYLELNGHQVSIEVVPKVVGDNKFTGLFRDFTIDLIPGNDSLGYRIADESFFEFVITAKKKESI